MSPESAAYQGQAGAYSEQAARLLCGPEASLLPCETLADVFAAVEQQRAQWAVVPIENTLAGAVPGVVTLLLSSGLTVHDETIARIDHVLAGPAGLALDDVREVLSHPVALAQCSRFFKSHPAVRSVPVFDTAGALDLVMREGPSGRAAIAGRAAAALYGAVVLVEHLQDHPDNFTRFLKAGPAPLPPVAGPAHVIIGARLPHRPGALARLLHDLAEAGANLTRIDSAPLHGSPFEYEFLIEGVLPEGRRAALDLPARMDEAEVRVIGQFATSGRQPAGLPR
jgi:prephenate dehydratase